MPCKIECSNCICCDKDTTENIVVAQNQVLGYYVPILTKEELPLCDIKPIETKE